MIIGGSRRQFTGILAGSLLASRSAIAREGAESSADVIIVGGGLGGCAAALACLKQGKKVVLTEPTDWLGGQLTSQAVPPDEHRWIESHGANRSYRELRERIRQFYRDNYRLTDQSLRDEFFNPGRGSVSRLCCEPRVALAVLENWLQPYITSGQLSVFLEVEPVSADCSGDRVRAVKIRSLRDNSHQWLAGSYFVDATELGDLLPLTETEFVTGAEAKSLTGELHGAETADPDNQQAFTVCFVLDYRPDQDHTIERPVEYDFWRNFVPQLIPPWPGRLLDLTYSHPRTLEPKLLGFDPTGNSTPGALNLWNYRRIIDHRQFQAGHFDSDVSLINWPQNDYFLGNLVGVSADQALNHVERAKQLSLSLLYWLQTEVPRVDGGHGYPGLRLRGDLLGTRDGLAKAPYIRESRRIKAELTVTEQHVGVENRRLLYGDRQIGQVAEHFTDSVGVGSYPIDLHPTTAGDNYIDFETYPFEIPLGALLPVRMENLLPACKNIGTTHLTSGCYRLHPVEWGIGEAVGHLINFSLERDVSPRSVRHDMKRFEDFQKFLHEHGVETAWPKEH
jgi:hypothetical protein